MLNKQIFETETGKLLVTTCKKSFEKMGWGWEGITFSVVAIFCFFWVFLLAFVFVVLVVAAVVVCLFVCFACFS